jgi:hypothetical protein
MRKAEQDDYTFPFPDQSQSSGPSRIDLGDKNATLRGEGRPVVKITAEETKIDDGAGVKVVGADGNSKRSRATKFRLNKLVIALAKDKTMVLLNNSQKLEAAVQAYSEACRMLQEVMIESPEG